MKQVLMIRHARKNGEDIDPAELSRIEKDGVPGVNEWLTTSHIIIHAGSAVPRTWHCAMALRRYLKRRGKQERLSTLLCDPRFGNETLFAEMTKDSLLMQAQKEIGWFRALSDVQPGLLNIIRGGLAEGVSHLFSYFDPGEEDVTLVTFGHSPLIELAAFMFDPEKLIDRKTALRELTGFRFIKEEDVRIVVADQLGF